MGFVEGMPAPLVGTVVACDGSTVTSSFVVLLKAARVKGALYSSVSQTGFRGTLGFHRTPFEIPREVVE